MNKYTVTVILMVLAINSLAATKIYKYTDENGNVHYTDKKPSEDAKEAQLKSPNIVESTPIESRPRWQKSDNTEQLSQFSFEGFAISSPQAGESIWGAGGNITVSVNLDKKLQPNYRVKFYLDGISHGKVKSNSQLIADVERGEHQIYAQVIDAFSRKVIKTSEPVTFYVKQHSKK
ncbi:MAG TPA: DUF4124 domain-containing protein [Oceanospirillales bacterium]|nr:DUF4124 domain-containing protein [Oceanospirillales bacterium]